MIAPSLLSALPVHDALIQSYRSFVIDIPNCTTNGL